jgi:hypothetical protein
MVDDSVGWLTAGHQPIVRPLPHITSITPPCQKKKSALENTTKFAAGNALSGSAKREEQPYA